MYTKAIEVKICFIYLLLPQNQRTQMDKYCSACTMTHSVETKVADCIYANYRPITKSQSSDDKVNEDTSPHPSCRDTL